MTDNEKRVSLVTGAARGIGAAIAARLAARGDCVAVTDVDLAAAEASASRIRAAGGGAFAMALDVASPASARAAVEGVLEREGRIDILVNNAGIAGLAAPVVDYPADEWRRILSIDLDEADIRAKMALYIRTGVPLVWLVDPRTQTIEEIRPAGADSGGASVVTRLLRADAGDVLEASDVLPAFRLSVQEVFD